MAKKITETKCTCQSCGNVSYYTAGDAWAKVEKAFSDSGKKSACCCSCCFPALFVPDKQTKDLNRCEKSGSRKHTKEKVTNEL